MVELVTWSESGKSGKVPHPRAADDDPKPGAFLVPGQFLPECRMRDPTLISSRAGEIDVPVVMGCG